MNTFKDGQTILIGSDLTESYNAFGRPSNGEMEKMKGKIYRVKKSYCNEVIIKSKDNDFCYTFHYKDICEPPDVKVTYPEPVHFNPEILLI
jgi:hypothetical protein